MTEREAIEIISRPFFMDGTPKEILDAHRLAISALEKQTCDGCIFNKRWKEDNCIDCARKAIDKYQRPLPEPYTEEES